jgi:acyl-CoA thioester hydrolase
MRVAHHAVYPVWFEMGRVELLRSLGFAFGEVEAAGFGQAVRELRVQYRRPAHFDQALSLRTALVAASGARLIFGFRLFDAAELDAASAPTHVARPEIGSEPAETGTGDDPAEPLAVGRTEMVWVSPTGRPIRLPRSHPLHAVLITVQRHPAWGEW